jgi:hypothetical protein
MESNELADKPFIQDTDELTDSATPQSQQMRQPDGSKTAAIFRSRVASRQQKQDNQTRTRHQTPNGVEICPVLVLPLSK